MKNNENKTWGYWVGVALTLVAIILLISWGLQTTFNGFNQVVGAPEATFGAAFNFTLFVLFAGMALNVVRPKTGVATVINNNVTKENNEQ